VLEEPIARILQELGSGESHQAWPDFLRDFSAPILQIIRQVEREPDHVSDCFLFVCEQLSRKRFQRLRRFRVDGPASFATWLQVVVRNLCLDWHRKEFGRHRVFQSVARLSPLDQAVFHCLYEFGATVDEAVLLLAPRFPAVSRQAVSECVERLENSLSPRQRWLLAARRGEASAQQPGFGLEADGPRETADPQPNPESAAELAEQRGRLARALESLAPRERLLLQFRFEEELTLDRIAKLMGLSDAQSADRQIQSLLRKLREVLA
jgi:RNA polymerase sigma factor (sigma-70 family)